MSRKSTARLACYEGVRKALLEHFEITKQGLRNPKGLKPAQMESVAEVQEQHRKVLHRIDRRIHDEEADGNATRFGKAK